MADDDPDNAENHEDKGDDQKPPESAVVAPVKIPLIWRLAEEDKVGIIFTKLKELKAKPAEGEEDAEPEPADEEPPEGDAPSGDQEKEYSAKQLLSLRHPVSGEFLLQWATRTNHFTLTEFIVQNGGRNAFAFKNKKELDIYKKWEDERERIRVAEEEKRKAIEAGEEPEEEPEAEEGEEKPDFATTTAEELGVSVYKVREIGDVGVYEGDKNPETGEREGNGLILFPNGDLYVGQYKNNKRNGMGTYRYKNGTFYTGEWVDNKRTGKGRIVYPDGGRYYGDWINNAKSGSGTFTYANGDQYVGAWRSDKKDGQGKYKFRKDSSSYEGQWKDGQFVKGVWQLNNNVVYEGEYKNGVPCGAGSFKFATPGVQTSGQFSEQKQWTGNRMVDLVQ
jgi:hypothetical protein